jgi:hypothetical protein
MSICRFSTVAGIALLAVGALSGCETAPQKMVEMKAAMTGPAEVPPTNSQGQGFAFINFDDTTKAISWKIYFSGLSAPATAAHFHGPSEPDANAGVVIPLVPQGTQPSSPITGSATLTPAQANQLMAGKWYVNVHSQASPGGEIRGQVLPEAW